MNDQTQQNAGATQSTPPTSNEGLANTDKPFNPWEGEPDPGEGGSGVGREEQQQQSNAGQATQGAEAKPAGQATGQAVAPAPATQGLTSADIASIVEKTVGATVKASQQAPVQQQFSEEDFIKTFQVFRPTPELLAKVGLPATPEGAAVFQNEIVTPIVRQAVTMAAFQMEKLKQDMTAHIKEQLALYEPARQMAVERTEAALKSEFLTANPDLKGFEPLLTEIHDRLKSQGTRFKSKEEAFKTVADHARSIIKGVPGLQNGAVAAENGQSTNTTNGASRMSGLSGSGQGGVGATARGAVGTKRKTQAETLFG